jgi:hypothetical protein
MRSRFEGRVRLIHGQTASSAVVNGSRLTIKFIDANGSTRSVDCDHAILATGYRVDLRRLGFLASEIRTAIRQVDHTLVLTRNFESSQLRLYFIGPAAANSFGPLLRFMVGAEFVSPRLATHLDRRASRRVAIEGEARPKGA